MNTYFAPGCGFKEYKPDLAQKMEHFLLKQGKTDGIHNACPTRDQPRVHHSVRAVLEKMNIKVAEAEKTVQLQK